MYTTSFIYCGLLTFSDSSYNNKSQRENCHKNDKFHINSDLIGHKNLQPLKNHYTIRKMAKSKIKPSEFARCGLSTKHRTLFTFNRRRIPRNPTKTPFLRCSLFFEI